MKKNIYYLIWFDGIRKMQANPAVKSEWKLYTMIFMSMSKAMYFLFFMAIFQRNILHVDFYDIEKLPFLENDNIISSFLKFFILFLSPFLLINYFLIFRNDRYKSMMPNYKYYNGKLYLAYISGSFGLIILACIVFLIYYALTN